MFISKSQIVILLVLIILAIGFTHTYNNSNIDEDLSGGLPKDVLMKERIVVERFNTISFVENFEISERIFDAAEPEKSTSAAWWVNSGGYLEIRNGVGSTIKGRLATSSDLVEKYALSKSERTDEGFRPQNIFRLLMQEPWQNSEQSLLFRVTDTDSTNSINRAGSNGILIFSNYSDQDNLYYAGIRVDGDLVIKKKIGGTYFTLAQRQIFGGEYNKITNPNLIPINTWIQLTKETITLENNEVKITVSIDANGDGEVDESLSVIDDGVNYGGKAFTDGGYCGIRTDFMDVEFDNYRIETFKK